MAEKAANELKSQFKTDLEELEHHRGLVTHTKEVLQTKQEFIENLRVEVLLLSSKVSSYQQSHNAMQKTLEETIKSQKISENTVLILKGQRDNDDITMADLTEKNSQLNSQLQTVIGEKNDALDSLQEKVSI